MPSNEAGLTRRRAILQAVQDHGQISVTTLADQLAISEVSVRRHLEQLERSRLIQRTHGGARSTASPGQPSTFEARLLFNPGIKESLGKAAAALIKPGESVILDSGTTILAIARQLPALVASGASLTVLTRSLSIASVLRAEQSIRLIVIGGLYLHEFDDFVGPLVTQALQSTHADILFMGTDGADAEHGLTTDNVLEAGLYTEMARRAARVVVVTDSSKIGITKVVTAVPLDAIHTFITDSGAPSSFVTALRERGCEVLVVPKPGVDQDTK